MKVRDIFGTLLAATLLWACANVGNPEGGPFDMQAPRLLGSKPELRALGVKGQRIELQFDEYVKISQQDKIIVSPPQIKPPLISANGKSVTLRLQDSLKPETTYSIYFDDAIVDNNEDNPIENFSYTFSTGQTIDTMQIAGSVLDAETLEPVGGVVIGAYWAGTVGDSTILKESFPFASKTSKAGVFTVRGLRDSVYRLFALKDDDNNYRYNGQSEGLAYTLEEFRTSKLDSIKTDTIKIDSIVRRDTLWRDSLVTYNHTYYKPDNVVLRYFTPKSKVRGLERNARLDSLRISLDFSEYLASAPQLRSLDKPNVAPDKLYEPSLSGRSVTYWLLDKDLISADSIRFALTYSKTDSLLQLSEQTDTLTFLKPKARAESKPKKLKEGEREPNPFRLTFTGAKGVQASTPHDSLIFTSNFPLERLDSTMIRLESSSDSVYKPQPFTLQRDSLDGMRYFLGFPRAYATRYRVRIDSASIRSIYGHVCDSLVFEQKIDEEKEFGRLAVTVKGLTSEAPLVAQLLSKSGDAMMTLSSTQAKAVDKPTADSLQTAGLGEVTFEFPDLKPDTYYLRLFLDEDRDGKWTTGDYPSRQPEMMYYSPNKYEVKKTFTTSETWEPLATPLNKQKPQELLKNKPEEKKRREDKNKEYHKRMADKQRK